MAIRPLLASLVALAFPAGCASPPAAPASDAALERIQAEALMRHVRHLASDELGGRSSKRPEGRVAARYVAAELERAGVEPLGDDGTFFQALEDPELSPNVLGIVRGTGTDLFWITAHYDHLAPLEIDPEEEAFAESKRTARRDTIFNGADDNASGTAVLIEVARAFAASAAELDASVAFAAFSAEELGLQGSRHMVQDPPLPLEGVRGVINLDMVSRGQEDLIFAEQGPGAAELAAAAKRLAPSVGLRMRWNEHPEWRSSSDHTPFMERGVPTIYFGVEDHPDYHRPGDEADKVLPALMERVGRLTFATVYELAARPPAP